MEKTQNTLRRSVGTVSVALTLAALTACTATDDRAADPASPSSSPAATADPSLPTSPPGVTTEPTSRAQSAVEPGQPFDVDEATTWTATIAARMAGTVEPYAVQGSSGHLDDTTSQNRTDRVTSLPAGDYSFSFACRGGGDVTFGIVSGGTSSPTLSGPCTGQVQGGDFTAEEGGTEFRLSATGAPTDYVVRYGAPIAR